VTSNICSRSFNDIQGQMYNKKKVYYEVYEDKYVHNFAAL